MKQFYNYIDYFMYWARIMASLSLFHEPLQDYFFQEDVATIPVNFANILMQYTVTCPIKYLKVLKLYDTFEAQVYIVVTINPQN